MFRRLLKLTSVLRRLGVGFYKGMSWSFGNSSYFLEASFDESKSSFNSALARLVRAFTMERLEADCFSGEM